jgi:4-hydroxy-tetrahydrodipicolinate reductase
VIVKKKNIKVIMYGLGPIGISAARILAQRQGIEIVGAVDIAEDKVGKDLGDVLGAETVKGKAISKTLDEAIKKGAADVVVHTTSSFMEGVFSQLNEIIAGGMNCVSSTEELFFPLIKNPDMTRKIDERAKKYSVTVIGTGVNPGFVMDTLPLFLTGVCERVDEVHIQRVVDASTRRFPLQRKVGASLAADEFNKGVAEGTFGHIGLRESLQFLATNIGWHLNDIEENVEPVLSERDISTEFFHVKKGQVAGIKNIGRGILNGKVVLSLDLRMFVGAEKSFDRVNIVGNPSLEVEIKRGTPGDIATASILANSVRLALHAEAGLINARWPQWPHYEEL